MPGGPRLTLLALAMPTRALRCAAVAAAVVVAGCVLVHHAHYTVDVVAAPVFAWGSWWGARRLMRAAGATTESPR